MKVDIKEAGFPAPIFANMNYDTGRFIRKPHPEGFRIQFKAII